MARQCFKVPYDSPGEARAALAQVRRRKRSDHRPVLERKFYLCRYCGKYHLTKMSKITDRTIDHRRHDHE